MLEATVLLWAVVDWGRGVGVGCMWNCGIVVCFVASCGVSWLVGCEARIDSVFPCCKAVASSE